MIEIFDDRMELVNPGKSLIDKARIVDHPPLSRNELLARFMRRINICEQRGSGWDKIVSQTEEYQLPTPRMDTLDTATRVTLFAHLDYA